MPLIILDRHHLTSSLHFKMCPHSGINSPVVEEKKKKSNKMILAKGMDIKNIVSRDDGDGRKYEYPLGQWCLQQTSWRCPPLMYRYFAALPRELVVRTDVFAFYD